MTGQLNDLLGWLQALYARAAMLKYDDGEIRLFTINDVRFLRQCA